MKRKNFDEVACPIARSLERVGERWSMLILRDAFYGITRFDDLVASLGIAPNMLSRRLTDLVGAGMLERRSYSEHPPRYEYVLTELGRDFHPVLISLLAWGNRHFAKEGPSTLIADRASGRVAEPVLVDIRTGAPISRSRHTVIPGPAADERTRSRIDFRSTRLALSRG